MNIFTWVQLISTFFFVSLSSATYLNSEWIIVWQQCLLSPICSNVWHSCCSTVKTSVSSHWQMVKCANRRMLTCDPHSQGLLIHSSIYITHFLGMVYLWFLPVQCVGQETSEQNPFPRLQDSTMNNAKHRARNWSICRGFIRILAGGHHLLHTAYLPRGEFDIQAPPKNSHSSNHAWHDLNMLDMLEHSNGDMLPDFYGVWTLPKEQGFYNHSSSEATVTTFTCCHSG